MKVLKIAAIGIGSLVALMIVLMIAIPYFFKDKIIDAALDAANESLTARIVVEPADIDFSLFSHFPNFTLTVENFAIEGTGRFEGTTLIRAPKMYAVIDLASVFSGTPVIGAVGIEDPVINIVTAKDGSANYDIVKPSDPDTDQAVDTSSLALNIDLKKYSISRARVDYTDSVSAMCLHIGNLTHSGSGAMRSERFSLDTRTSIDTLTLSMDGTRYVKDARITGDITLDMDMGAMVFAIDTGGEKYNLRLNDIDLLCEGSIGMLDGGGMNIDLHLGSGQTQFSSLLSMLPAQYASMLEGVKTQGTFCLDATLKGLYAENSMPAIDAVLKAENGRIQYPELPESIDDIQIDVRIVSPQSASLDAMTIDVSPCTMRIAGSPLSAGLHMSTPISDPDIQAWLKAALDVAELRRVIPLEDDDKVSGKINADVSIAGRLSWLEKGNYQDFKAEGGVSIENLEYATGSLAQAVRIPKAELVFSPKALQLKSFDLLLGESDLSLSGAVENYLGYYLKNQTLRGNLKVASQNMELSSILPHDDAPQTPQTPDPAAETSADQPIRLPQNIRFDTQLDLKKITYGNIVLSNVKGNLGLYDGIAYLKGISLDVVQGQANVSGTYDARDAENASVDLNFSLARLDIPQLAGMFSTVRTLAPVAASLGGQLGGSIRLNTRLDATMTPVYSSMNSKGTLTTQGLVWKNSEFSKMLGRTLGIAALENDPKIEDLNLSYTISDGKLTIAPTSFKLAGIGTKLSGGMDLEGMQLDMLSELEVPRTMLSENLNQTIDKAVSTLSSLGVKTSIGQTIEIAGLITGSAASPKYALAYGPDHSPSLGDYLKSETEQAAKKAADQVKAKAEEKVKEETDKLKDKAVDALKGLFGKKKLNPRPRFTGTARATKKERARLSALRPFY